MTLKAKVTDFSIIQEGDGFSILLHDRDVETTDPWEKTVAEWGKIQWELPPDISRYLGQLNPEQKRVFLLPSVINLRTLQWILLASMDVVRAGFGGFSAENLQALYELLCSFTKEAAEKQEEFMPEG